MDFISLLLMATDVIPVVGLVKSFVELGIESSVDPEWWKFMLQGAWTVAFANVVRPYAKKFVESTKTTKDDKVFGWIYYGVALLTDGLLAISSVYPALGEKVKKILKKGNSKTK